MKQIAVMDWKIDRISRALDIDHKSTRRILEDGRNATFILKQQLAKKFAARIVECDNAPAHLIVRGRVWAVRSMTKKSGVSFCPQAHIGAGRHFRPKEFVAFVQGLSGFFVCDNSSFPTITVWKMGKNEVMNLYLDGELNCGRLKANKFIELARKGAL